MAFGSLGSRKQHNPQMEVSDAGQLEPVEPAYYKPVASSPVRAHMDIPSEPTEWKAPVVMREQDTSGMRYLWAHGAVRQPLQPWGTGPDLGIAVNSQEFQPELIGPIHDAGFNDKLFRAGYPGFNLGISFKVQTLPTQVTGPGQNIKMRSSNIRIKIQRATGTGSVVSNEG